MNYKERRYADKPRIDRHVLIKGAPVMECVSLKCRGTMVDQKDGKLKCDTCQLVIRNPRHIPS